MMRSLWTAASGMTSQQINVDTISNNLANINTNGYKKQNAQFQSLLYQTIQEKSTDSEGIAKPIGIQVGLGVRNSAISSQFTQGNFLETGNEFDFAVEGDGFFMVATDNGEIAYTRNGSFTLSNGVEGLTLTTSDGYPVLDSNGYSIVIDESYSISKLDIDEYGNLLYPDESNNGVPIGIKIGLVQFNNPVGLEKSSGSLLKETVSSGYARIEGQDPNLSASKVRRRFLEGSNVSAIDEMVNLIVAQRAYEMNSKVITASDEMLQQANNLR
ncbi:MAG TPA: flagellar hook-basal body protein [Clostridiales bacterium]|nr:flagellar hook-basal body protein [Clostridiales bacterium]